MPDFSASPVSWGAQLARLFAEKPALAVCEAAAILGWSEAQVRLSVSEVGASLDDERVRWEDVAFWLLDAWPRQRLLDALGPAAALLPRGLHLTHAPWQLPRYLVHGLTRQAALQLSRDEVEHGLMVQDYVARVLHLAIEPETVSALARDAVFREAWEYPQ
ncbi:MAG TPA: hypothetical protein VFO89_09275 [Thermoanaerobaculia bacterium]|nr:hypothetical protein [Thermoanaerobaculia bacterium]